MSLNYWKIGGQPTSYNPLPTTMQYVYVPLFKNYVISFRAKSASNARLEVDSYTSVNDMDNIITLTTYFKTYSFTWYESDVGKVALTDLDVKGDIIIDSITIVQKPLPNLTINGVDGFLSGKWIYDNGSPAGNGGCGHLTIVDDKTATLNNTDGLWRSGFVQFDAQPNTTYTYSGTYSYDNGLINVPVRIDSLSSGQTGVNGGTVIVNSSSGGTGNLKYTFTTPSDCKQICLYLQSASISNLTLQNPVVNVGSTPTPYSKKTGTKMVMPLPGKNLFDGQLEQGDISGSTGQSQSSSATVRSVNYIPVKPNTTYNLSRSVTVNALYVLTYGSSKSFISNLVPSGITGSGAYFTTDANTYFIRFTDYSNNLSTKIQIEQGNAATQYTPYAPQVNKTPGRTNANGQPTILASNTGLSFNKTDYVDCGNTLSFTGDFSCEELIYPITLSDYNNDIGAKAGWGAFQMHMSANGSLYAGTDLANRFILNSGTIQVNNWYKLKYQYKSGIGYIFINDVLISSKAQNAPTAWNGFIIGNTVSTNGLNAILKYVKLYDGNGNIVLNYDFTNPQAIVGNTVIPNPQNLIPSFEDSRWSIHANAKVMGKDVLHLDATSSDNSSIIILPVDGSKRFELALTTNGRWTVHFLDANQNYLNGIGWQTGNSYIFKASDYTASSVYYFKIWTGNPSAGSFDFVKPQLYQLTGQEGTINGNPVQLNKPSKRNLYAKR